MDLSCFATKKNADEGVWFPVKIDGNKVPLAILIYGSDSDVVKEFDIARIRKLGLKKNSTEIDDETLDELIESQDETVIVRIGQISAYDWKKKCNTEDDIELFGQKLTNDKKSYRFLIENFPAIKEFIKEKSDERANFLSQGKVN